MSDFLTMAPRHDNSSSDAPLYWKLGVQRQKAVDKLQESKEITDIVQGPLPYLSKRQAIEDIARGRASEFAVGANMAKEFAVIVADDLIGLGGLETLIRDESIYNITIKWFEGEEAQIGLHRIGGDTKERFNYPLALNLSTLREGIIGNKAIRFSGQPVNWTYASPHVTLYLPTHKIRIAANMLHDNKSIIVSVRMNRTGQPDLDEIYETGMIPSRGMYNFLKVMLASRANFLVVGSVGSGKTTLLRSLLHSVDYHDYLYVVEDSPELDLDTRSDKHDMILPLVPTKERDMASLIRDSQRFMADRIIIGEALDDSIIDWFTVANVTGGSGMTLHAEEPGSIFRRVKNMCGSKLSEREVYERLAESVDIILFVRRRYDRIPERQIENIWTLTRQIGADGKPIYAELWGYNPLTHKVEWKNLIPDQLQDKFASTGVRLGLNETDAEFLPVPGRPLDPLLKGILSHTPTPAPIVTEIQKPESSDLDDTDSDASDEDNKEDLLKQLFGGSMKGIFNGR